MGQFGHEQSNYTADHISTCFGYDWIYIGEVTEGVYDTPFGIGIKVWKNGIISEGYWEDDKLNGRGRVINFDGEYYIGDWEGGSRNGEGTHYDKDGNRYEGGWKHDSYYGQGTFYANNGNKYTGEWDGFIKGQGQINYKDGKKYIGQWDHYGGYKRHGLGTLYSADGQVLNKGMWHWDEYEVME